MVKVKFFAVLKGLVGTEEAQVEVDKEISLDGLVEKLKVDLPALNDIMQRGGILISVNEEMANSSSIIKDGDEVAFLPPFAGG